MECRHMTNIFEDPIPSTQKTDTEVVSSRDERGRFVIGGKPGPGRPRGARSALAETFVQDVLAVWREHGIEMLNSLITQKPGELIRAVASIVARAGVPMNVAIPAVRSPEEALAAATTVLDAIAAGSLTEGEARAVNACLDNWLRAYEAIKLQERVASLEAQLEGKS
jgi:hypothetical protein